MSLNSLLQVRIQGVVINKPRCFSDGDDQFFVSSELLLSQSWCIVCIPRRSITPKRNKDPSNCSRIWTLSLTPQTPTTRGATRPAAAVRRTAKGGSFYRTLSYHNGILPDIHETSRKITFHINVYIIIINVHIDIQIYFVFLNHKVFIKGNPSRMINFGCVVYSAPFIHPGFYTDVTWRLGTVTLLIRKNLTWISHSRFLICLLGIVPVVNDAQGF